MLPVKSQNLEIFLVRIREKTDQKNCVFGQLCGNCAFPQNFHTIKLGEITAFYTVDNVNNEFFHCMLDR